MFRFTRGSVAVAAIFSFALVFGAIAQEAEKPDQAAPAATEMQPAPAPEQVETRAAPRTEAPAPAKPPAARKTTPPAEEFRLADFEEVIFFFYSAGQYPLKINSGEFAAKHMEIFHIPFNLNRSFTIPLALRKPYHKESADPVASSYNLMRLIYFVDQPLFTLFSRSVVSQMVGSVDGPPPHAPRHLKQVGRRVKILDTLLFGLYKRDTWGHDLEQYDLTILNFPLDIRTFERASTKAESTVRFLDSPLFSITRVAQAREGADDTGALEVRTLDTFLAGVFQYEQDSKSSRWTALPLPMLSLAASKKNPREQRFTFLGTESENSILPDWTLNPALAVYYQKSKADGTEFKDTLRLPLIGPIFSTWKKDGESHWSLFPRIVFMRSYPG